MNSGIKATLCTMMAASVMFGVVTGCSKASTASTTAADKTAEITTAETTESSTDAGSDSIAETTSGTDGTDQLTVVEYPNGSYISIKDPGSKLPETGTVGGCGYTLNVDKAFNVTGLDRGYMLFMGIELDSPITFVICSGTKNTGGHDIKVVDLGMDGNKLVIVVEETSPDPDEMVTEGFEYPYCAIQFDEMPESFEIINTAGVSFTYVVDLHLDPDGDPDTYFIDT